MDLGDNWWAVLLSGTAGAVIGGIATLGAALLVLSHERRARRREALDQSVVKFAALAQKWVLLFSVDGDPAGRQSRVTAMVEAEFELVTRCWITESALQRTSQLLSKNCRSDDPALRALAAEDFSRLAARWLSDPDSVREGRAGFKSIKEKGVTPRPPAYQRWLRRWR